MNRTKIEDALEIRHRSPIELKSAQKILTEALRENMSEVDSLRARVDELRARALASQKAEKEIKAELIQLQHEFRECAECDPDDNTYTCVRADRLARELSVLKQKRRWNKY